MVRFWFVDIGGLGSGKGGPLRLLEGICDFVARVCQ